MQSISLNKPGAFSHKIDFPSEWNELTPAEIEFLAAAQIANGTDIHVSKAHVFISLIESRAFAQHIFLPADWKQKLNYEDAATQGFDAIDFLYKEQELTKNPYKELKVGNKRMIGPADNFDEILCGEMEDCEVFYLLFSQEPELEYLLKIAAILWRPRNAPYDSKASEKRYSLFASLTPEQLFVIYMWYTGCRNQLPKIFAEVYEGGTSNGTEPDITAFTKCIHAGAGPKNGTRDNIRKMPAKEFLFDMNLEAIHAKEIAKAHDTN